MARFEILIKPSAVKEIEALGRRSDRQRVVRKIRDLAENPRPAGCRKLTGKEWYRIRQGTFRIVYSIEDERLIVFVVKIGNRKDIYRSL